MTRSAIALTSAFLGLGALQFLLPDSLTAQEVRTRPRIVDNAPDSMVRVGPGSNPRRPDTFQQYYYGAGYDNFALSPYVFTIPTQPVPRVAGPSVPYAPLEYSKLVMSQMEAPAVEASGSRRNTQSIVQQTTAPGSLQPYHTAETRIVAVGDRGTLITDTREEVTLRGLSIPTERDNNEITRYYAREAARTIQELTNNQTVFIKFDEPLRGRNGHLLGTIFLQDGTNLNRLMLERGLAQFVSEHFLPDQNTSELAQAQETARSNFSGLWSR